MQQCMRFGAQRFARLDHMTKRSTTSAGQPSCPTDRRDDVAPVGGVEASLWYLGLSGDRWNNVKRFCFILRLVYDKKIQHRFHSLSPFLDERMRRLVAAARSEAIGYGGVSAVARATGVSRPTIAEASRN